LTQQSYPPLYVAAYDVEADPEVSVPATRAVAAVHRRHQAPATFFIVTRLLETAADEFRAILDDELFDIQSHTHTHARLKELVARDERDALQREIEHPRELIRDTFGRDAQGLTTPGGYTDGLRGESTLLRMLHDCGFRFVRSDARGPRETVPAPLTQPYWYAAAGFSDVLELPPQLWHDNILKGYTQGSIRWPPQVPWGVPATPPESPEEEFAVWRTGADYAVETGLRVYMPTMHAWSMYRLSRDARTIDLLLRHVRDLGMEVASCREVYERACAGQETFPDDKVEPPVPEAWNWPRDSLLSGASHDLRTPLHPIVGFAHLLTTGAHGPLNERQQDCAEEILRCAERLAYLFEETVTAEKLAAKRLPVELEVLSLEAIGRQLPSLAVELPAPQPEVRVTIEPGAEAVWADEDRLLELCGALVRNSAAFSPGRARIAFRARRAGERVLIMLSDEGPGIPAEIAPMIFLPLFRGRSTPAPFPQGLGLGLTIASRLTRLMGGELRLEQADGPGACFVVDLAAAEPPEQS
jgi:signal transduction histidine kinase